MAKTINMDLNELIEEHENLVWLLHDTIVKLTKEYNKQLKELEQYKQLYGGFDKVRYVMHEFKHGKLRSRNGQIVTNPKQAIAIALSEQRRYDS